MKKFAANYLMLEDGSLLKNGIVVAEDDGTILELIDTKGNLRETELLTFHNGILMVAIEFVRTSGFISHAENHNLPFVVPFIPDSMRISSEQLIEAGKQNQEQFPELKIPDLMKRISEILLSNGAFKKEKVSGIFLLSGVDLVNLKFTPQSRLKRIH